MSLHGPYDDSNIFAKVLRGEMASFTAFEDDVALAIMDLFPQVKGHTLVLPKNVRARHFLDLPPATVGPYMERVQRVAQAVERAFQPDGVTIMQFNGAPAGQTIFHLHYHVLPRFTGDSMAGHGHAKRADAAELEALAKKIAAHM